MKSFLDNFYRHLAIFSGHTVYKRGQEYQTFFIWVYLWAVHIFIFSFGCTSLDNLCAAFKQYSAGELKHASSANFIQLRGHDTFQDRAKLLKSSPRAKQDPTGAWCCWSCSRFLWSWRCARKWPNRGERTFFPAAVRKLRHARIRKTWNHFANEKTKQP